jgi:hypothetical protein
LIIGLVPALVAALTNAAMGLSKVARLLIGIAVSVVGILRRRPRR